MNVVIVAEALPEYCPWEDCGVPLELSGPEAARCDRGHEFALKIVAGCLAGEAGETDGDS